MNLEHLWSERNKGREKNLKKKSFGDNNIKINLQRCDDINKIIKCSICKMFVFRHRIM